MIRLLLSGTGVHCFVFVPGTERPGPAIKTGLGPDGALEPRSKPAQSPLEMDHRVAPNDPQRPLGFCCVIIW